MTALYLSTGVLVGSLLTWLILKSAWTARLTRAAAEIERARAEIEGLRNGLQERTNALHGQLTKLEGTLAVVNQELMQERGDRIRAEERLAQESMRRTEQVELLDKAQQTLKDVFNSLSHEALKANSQQFLQNAKQFMEQSQASAKTHYDQYGQWLDQIGKGIAERIVEVNKSVQEMDKTSVSIKQHLEHSNQLTDRVGREARYLADALKNSRIQGKWGEQQLRNVVEAAGMLEYCDFVEQDSLTHDEGRARPDMVVKLPNGHKVIVDAKAPLKSYLEAIEASDPAAEQRLLAQHVESLKLHIKTTAARNYPTHFAGALEYTLIFLPGDCFYHAAASFDPELARFAQEQKVIVTTPASLVAFLRVVSYGWTELKIQQNAQEISNLGKQMHKYLLTFLSHFNEVGKKLGDTVKHYNKAVGSYQGRLRKNAERFEELGATSGELLPEPEEVLTDIRLLDHGTVEELRDDLKEHDQHAAHESTPPFVCAECDER